MWIFSATHRSPLPNGIGRIEHEARHIDVADAAERGRVDPLAERRHRLVQAGRVDEHDLFVGRVSTPMMRWRVVCGLSDTMLILRPQIALTSDDLPTLGRPTNVTKPESELVRFVGHDLQFAKLSSMTRTINGIDELKTLVGEHLGYSPYVEITQEQVNTFADATGDHQWIHIDVERAKSGPFGGPIAHGYLTLSLGPTLSPQIFVVSGISMGVNYGCGKVRFPSPVPVGSNLRLGVTLVVGRGRPRRCAGDAGVRVRGRGCEQAVVRRRSHLPLLRLTGRPTRTPGRSVTSSVPEFSLAEVLEAIAATRPDAECLVFGDLRLTWSRRHRTHPAAGELPARPRARLPRRTVRAGKATRAARTTWRSTSTTATSTSRRCSAR